MLQQNSWGMLYFYLDVRALPSTKMLWTREVWALGLLSLPSFPRPGICCYCYYNNYYYFYLVLGSATTTITTTTTTTTAIWSWDHHERESMTNSRYFRTSVFTPHVFLFKKSTFFDDCNRTWYPKARKYLNVPKYFRVYDIISNSPGFIKLSEVSRRLSGWTFCQEDVCQNHRNRKKG